MHADRLPSARKVPAPRNTRRPRRARAAAWWPGSSERWVEQRRFGLVVGPALCVLAALLWQWKHLTTAPTVLAGIGAGLVLAALVVPVVLVPVQRVWAAMAFVLGWINSRVLLTIVFFAVVTPTSLILRLLRRDPMRRRWRDPDAQSYWLARELKPFESEDFQRQF